MVIAVVADVRWRSSNESTKALYGYRWLARCEIRVNNNDQPANLLHRRYTFVMPDGSRSARLSCTAASKRLRSSCGTSRTAVGCASASAASCRILLDGTAAPADKA